MKLDIIIILLLNITLSYAQIDPGARQAALSHSDIAQSNDVFSIFNNPAGLAQMYWREIGIYYSPAPFGINELANGFAAYHEPTDWGSFAVGFMTYGFDLYRENKFALSYSNRMFENFFLGITALYQIVSIRNYGNDGTLNFLTGGLLYLNRNLRFGFSIHNVTRATYGEEENQIPTTYLSGLSYDFNDDVTINISIEKELEYPASLHFGIEYLPIKFLYLRFGFTNLPSTFSTGIGISYSSFQLDYALFTHQDLGLTHQVGMIIHFSSDSSRTEKIKEYLNIK